MTRSIRYHSVVGLTAGSGIAAGIIAGLVFLAGQSIASYWLGGTVSGPARLVATLILGPGALSREYPLFQAVSLGVVINNVLSAMYGAIAGGVLARRGSRGASVVTLLQASVAYGALLWAVNYLVIASLAFPQFAATDFVWHGLFAHAALFGLPLGLWLARARRSGRGALP